MAAPIPFDAPVTMATLPRSFCESVDIGIFLLLKESSGFLRFRQRHMKRFILVLLLSGLFVTATAAQSTIFFVRHAEKAGGGGDNPDLSEAGRARAESLATVLKDADISAIYTTELKRTQQTAAPLAK